MRAITSGLASFCSHFGTTPPRKTLTNLTQNLPTEDVCDMLMEVVIVAQTKVPEVELSGEGTESESSKDVSDDKDGEAVLNRDAPPPSM